MRIPQILAAACLMLVSCQQEEGCTDPEASNYNPEATMDDGSCGQPTIDGYTYQTVAIGDQVWFAENLRTAVYANGDAIPSSLTDEEWSSTTAGAVGVYGEALEWSGDCLNHSPDIDACDDAQSLAVFGRLYNWPAVDDARGLCPTGWHVPTEGEWTELVDYVTAQGFGGTEGTALKSTTGWGPTDWNTNGNGTDDFGFSGLPGGYRNATFPATWNYSHAGRWCIWWSSSIDPDSPVWPTGAPNYCALRHEIHNVQRYWFNQNRGLSVRCIQD